MGAESDGTLSFAVLRVDVVREVEENVFLVFATFEKLKTNASGYDTLKKF